MPQWVVIDNQEHRNFYWTAPTNYRFAMKQQVVEVLISELSEVLQHYTLAFRRGSNSQIELIAILGLGGSRNVYLDLQDKWMCEYVPARLRSYPFILANVEQDQEMVLCIESSHMNEGHGENNLFEEDGSLSTSVSSALQFLKACNDQQIATNEASGLLEKFGVLEEWRFEINDENGNLAVKIDGLLHINENKLNEMEGENLQALKSSGALQIAYAQLFSQIQVKKLALRANTLYEEARKSEVAAEDLDRFFSDGGTLSFE